MSRHRTTPRALLGLLAVVLLGLTAGTADAQSAGVPQLIFPVVGQAAYIDDYGDPRGQGRHEGNDIMSVWRAPVVAVEDGTVKFHTTSWRAGCMLYLEGDSGTEYIYVHLNNDLTRRNDNRGRCVPGVAYARGLKSGARVAAGEQVGYVGDSGDANGIQPHLHFEVHPNGGRSVSPFPHLKRAKKLLFAAKPGTPFTAALRGKVVDTLEGTLTLNVTQVSSWPGGFRGAKVQKQVELMVPPETAVFSPLGALIAGAKLSALKPGQAAVAWTQKALATLEAQLGEPMTLATERIVLSS
jgi:Peptidase family M23